MDFRFWCVIYLRSKSYIVCGSRCGKQHFALWLSLQWRHDEHDGVSNHQRFDCLLNRLFRPRSKKTSKLSVTGLCDGNSPVTGEFPAQSASNAENVSIWWRHHGDYDVLFWGSEFDTPLATAAECFLFWAQISNLCVSDIFSCVPWNVKSFCLMIQDSFLDQ